MRLISVLIPTQRRPGGLLTAARSVLRQTLPDDVTLELLIVDNDPDGSAAAGVSALAATSEIPVQYLHAPHPGVATARNRGVAAARGDFIACLDDDEEACEGWLAALLYAAETLNADVVFGPISTRLPPNQSACPRYFSHFFARSGPRQDQPIAKPFGCGNSLIRVRALPDRTAPFKTARDHLGGEDDHLFAAMAAKGARFGFAAQALVYEHPSLSRLTLSYCLKRAFSYGQGATAEAARHRGFGGARIAATMVIGLAQAVGCALIALSAAAFAPEFATRAADKAARGLGKVVWLERWHPKFYGRVSGR